MASSEAERLHEIYTAYREADRAKRRDLREAVSEEEVDAVLDTADALKAVYYRAVNVALDATGPLVEAAWAEAREANKRIREAREAAAALPERIRLGARVLDSIQKLVEAADG